MFNAESYSHSIGWKVFKNSSRSVCADDTASERDGLHFPARLIPQTDKIPAHPPGRRAPRSLSEKNISQNQGLRPSPAAGSPCRGADPGRRREPPGAQELDSAAVVSRSPPGAMASWAATSARCRVSRAARTKPRRVRA